MTQVGDSLPGQHLLIYLPTLVGGGAERVLMNLAVGFVDRGYRVDFVLAQNEGAFIKDFPSCLNRIELNSRHYKAGRSILSLPALIRYINRENPSVLLTGLHANIIAIWAKKFAKRPLRVVITEHNTLSMTEKTRGFLYRSPLSWLIRKNYPKADQIVAVSNGVAEDLCNYANIQKEKVKVIPNPVITTEMVMKTKEELDHPWFKPGQPPVILAVGRLTGQKDYPLLINAFAQVYRQFPSRLMILGEGPDRPQLQALINELNLEDAVSLPGFVHNPYPFMVNSSLFVLSSQWEGLPTVLVEALYCGTPVIATDCPNGPREILENGKFGALVPVGDQMALAEAILSALKSPPEKPAGESWERYKTDAVLDQYSNVLFGKQT